MTRDEFIDGVRTWWELIDWCNRNNCHLCNEVWSAEDYDDRINEELEDWSSEESWQTVRDRLDELPDGYDYYEVDDWGDWSGLAEDDFDDRFEEVLDWGDNNEIWEWENEASDDVEEEDVPAEEPDPEDQIPIEDEDVSLCDLFSSCSSTIQRITRDQAEQEAREESEAEEAFKEFILDTVGGE